MYVDGQGLVLAGVYGTLSYHSVTTFRTKVASSEARLNLPLVYHSQHAQSETRKAECSMMIYALLSSNREKKKWTKQIGTQKTTIFYTHT